MTDYNQSINNSSTYDEIPYESYPYNMSHPSHMMTLGTLFGMQPTPIEKAKVLELGCAAGGNIIPHAINFPNATFIGVDLSKVQIDQAKKTVSDLELKNIEFYNCSITDIDNNFGKFDYIICHGVISWVPEDVRNKIFEVCNKNLNENGIAYISYNTLPGWNMVRTIRDMMLYHSTFFNSTQDKLNQSKLFLNFVNDALEGQTSPYAQILKQESQLLASQPDHYIRHDHLEEENKQFYFEDFINNAKQQGLQYLADSSLATMFVGNMPIKVAEKLQEVKDIVRTEQYMDFINNRRFRSTLLTHQSVKLNRSLNINDIEKFYLSMNIVADKPLSEVKLTDALDNISFSQTNNKDLKISTSSPAMKAILYTFAENLNYPLNTQDLIKLADKKLGGGNSNEIKTELFNNALRLALNGHISLTINPPKKNKINKIKPQLNSLTSYQLQNPNALWVTNVRHEVLGINIIEKLMLNYMNAKRSKAEILDLIKEDFYKGTFNLNRNDVKIENFEDVSNDIDITYEELLKKAEVNGILI